MLMAMTVSMAVMTGAAQQPCACDIDQQAYDRDWDGLTEMDRYRRQETRHRLIADQQGDHCEHDGRADWNRSERADRCQCSLHPRLGCNQAPKSLEMPAKKPRRAPHCGANTPMPEPLRI